MANTILVLIHPSHESCNTSDQYPPMHHFVTEMCTSLLQNGTLRDMELLYCVIYTTCQL